MGIATAASATNQKVPPKPEPPLVIVFNPGGGILDFIRDYNEIAQTHRRIIIKGECISACTLMPGLVDPSQVCVYPSAVFAFHSATESAGDGPDFYSPEGTQIIWYLYPPAVRRLLEQLGMGPNIEHREFIWIPADTFYQHCNPHDAS